MITYQIEEVNATDLECGEFLDLLQIVTVMNKHTAMMALYGCGNDVHEAVLETTQQQEMDRGYCRIKFPV